MVRLGADTWEGTLQARGCLHEDEQTGERKPAALCVWLTQPRYCKAERRDTGKGCAYMHDARVHAPSCRIRVCPCTPMGLGRADQTRVLWLNQLSLGVRGLPPARA